MSVRGENQMLPHAESDLTQYSGVERPEGSASKIAAEDLINRTEIPDLEFTGERIVAGKVGEDIFRDHEVRYVFAGGFVKDKDVLDLACGSGIGTHYLLKAGARKCVGIDIDGEAIGYAKAAYKGCLFEQCEAASTSLPDSSIDVVVSFETIEHLRDPSKFLLECNRVLRPGGILICSTPNRVWWRWHAKNPFHVCEFTATEFAGLMATCFNDVQLFSQNHRNLLFHAPRAVVVRLLGDFKLKHFIKKCVGRKPGPIALRTEFDALRVASCDDIRAYRSAPIMQPMYFIAVARRPTAQLAPKKEKSRK